MGLGGGGSRDRNPAAVAFKRIRACVRNLVRSDRNALTARARARVEVLVIVEVLSRGTFVVTSPSLSLKDKDTEMRVNHQERYSLNRGDMYFIRLHRHTQETALRWAG